MIHATARNYSFTHEIIQSWFGFYCSSKWVKLGHFSIGKRRKPSCFNLWFTPHVCIKLNSTPYYGRNVLFTPAIPVWSSLMGQLARSRPSNVRISQFSFSPRSLLVLMTQNDWNFEIERAGRHDLFSRRYVIKRRRSCACGSCEDRKVQTPKAPLVLPGVLREA